MLTKNHFAQPGLFRLILAALVLVDHSTSFAKLGTAAVFLFFILSGYWIYRMWEKSYSHAAAPYRTFIVSRYWRLLPVLLTATIITVATRLALGDIPEWNAQVVFSSLSLLGYSQLPMKQMLLQPAWSLDIEMQFYLLAPLVIYFMDSGRVKGAWKMGIDLAVVVSLYLLLGSYVKGEPANYISHYAAFFLIGMTAAKRNWKPSGKIGGASLLIALGLLLVVYGSHELRGVMITGGKMVNPLYIYNRPFSILLALTLAPFALFTVTQKSTALDRHLGNLSYPVYLNHWAGILVIEHSFAALPMMARLPYVVTIWAAIFIVSVVVYILIDVPVNRMRERWVKASTKREKPDQALAVAPRPE